MRFAALFLTSALALTGAASAQQAPAVAAAALGHVAGQLEGEHTGVWGSTVYRPLS
mgnify:CR=1 FL=1